MCSSQSYTKESADLLRLPYPAGDSGVTERLAHQVSQQRVGPQEAELDVGGLGELPQHRRVGEVHRPGTAVHQRHHDLREGRKTLSDKHLQYDIV